MNEPTYNQLSIRRRKKYKKCTDCNPHVFVNKHMMSIHLQELHGSFCRPCPWSSLGCDKNFKSEQRYNDHVKDGRKNQCIHAPNRSQNNPPSIQSIARGDDDLELSSSHSPSTQQSNSVRSSSNVDNRDAVDYRGDNDDGITEHSEETIVQSNDAVIQQLTLENSNLKDYIITLQREKKSLQQDVKERDELISKYKSISGITHRTVETLLEQ